MGPTIYIRYDPHWGSWAATFYPGAGPAVEMPTKMTRDDVYTWVAGEAGITFDEAKDLLAQTMYSNTWVEL